MYEYQIWQLKDTPENAELLFAPLREVDGREPDKGNYECVYVEKDLRKQYCPCLEEIYTRFQKDLTLTPETFHGHSLSVSDVVVFICRDGSEGSMKNESEVVFYCDSIGFKHVCWKSEKPKKYTDTRLVAEAYTSALAQGLLSDWIKIEDYFLTDNEPVNVTKMEFDFMAVPSYGGCEGIYIDCAIKGRFDDSGERKTKPVGTFKTLDTNLDAMIIAGKVSGVMTAMVREVIDANWNSFE